VLPTALVGAGAAAHRVIRQLRAQPGQYVGVVGAHGILGHMSIQIAKALGYVVVCLDPSYEMMPGNIYTYIHEPTETAGFNPDVVVTCFIGAKPSGADVVMELDKPASVASILDYVRFGHCCRYRAIVTGCYWIADTWWLPRYPGTFRHSVFVECSSQLHSTKRNHCRRCAPSEFRFTRPTGSTAESFVSS
jgi:hypothetical protein